MFYRLDQFVSGHFGVFSLLAVVVLVPCHKANILAHPQTAGHALGFLRGVVLSLARFRGQAENRWGQEALLKQLVVLRRLLRDQAKLSRSIVPQLYQICQDWCKCRWQVSRRRRSKCLRVSHMAPSPSWTFIICEPRIASQVLSCNIRPWSLTPCNGARIVSRRRVHVYTCSCVFLVSPSPYSALHLGRRNEQASWSSF
jgi:hypothetical protein